MTDERTVMLDGEGRPQGRLGPMRAMRMTALSAA